MPEVLEALPARRISAPVFGVGLLGCALGGAIQTATVASFVWDPFVQLLTDRVEALVGIWGFCCIPGIPLNLVILPLAWAGYRRSRRQVRILYVVGISVSVLVQVYLQAKFGIIPSVGKRIGFAVAVSVGAVSGVVSATLFSTMLGKSIAAARSAR